MSDDADRLLYLPRFSIRTVLFVTTLFALLFVMIGLGVRGHVWAWGFAIGVASLAVTALVHAACFGVVWWFARLSVDKLPTAANGSTDPAQEPRR
jgi:hypothetical protein